MLLIYEQRCARYEVSDSVFTVSEWGLCEYCLPEVARKGSVYSFMVGPPEDRITKLISLCDLHRELFFRLKSQYKEKKQ